MKSKFVNISLIVVLLQSIFAPAIYGQGLETSNDMVSSTLDNKVDYSGERQLNFNKDWRFKRETEGSIQGAQNPDFDDSSWRQLNLPHDWSIELDFNPNSKATHEGGFLDGGIGWYRKTFTLPSSMEGKQISIDFDGVYMDSTTYLNGEVVGNYPYGYNAFSYDITDLLHTDGRENVLVVKVKNIQPSSRWYSGSGIYRNVHLTVTEPIHVARYGTFVTTPDLETAYKQGKANVNIETEINNETADNAEVTVKSTIYDKDGTEVATVQSDPKTIDAGATTHFEDNTTISNPVLWDIDNPYRYQLVTEVISNEQILDTYKTKFGVRFFEFDSAEGFSLNGEYMKLKGASMHHDLGALGAATNARAVERQMQIMKDMGVNAIRVTHNPASPELLEAANFLGLLVVEEAFDTWNQSKKTYDYGRFFSEWAEHDIKEMVDRGKNEPSIIMWSIGNEIYDSTSDRGVQTAKDLVRWVKEIDTTRPTTIGEDKTRGDKVNPTPVNENIKEIFNIVDVVGLNYSENNYAPYHEQYPEWKLYGSETSSATRSRGIYTHPYEYNSSTKYADLQQSSYDNDYVGWGRTAEDAWVRDRDLKHIAGQFIWTGFDYIGEPTPYYNTYPAKSSYFGAVDTAGFPKDIFYYYQSQWTEEPMVHLLPHWNWEKGETVRVLAYTNAHSVELFLNGKSIGERSYETKTTSWGSTYKETAEGDTYLEWAVPFEAGELEAVAKDENGNVIARDEVVTAGEPAAVRLTADRQVIDADGNDLSFITVDVVDDKGTIVPNAENLVHFDVSGNGSLVGVDNGNAASVERYKANKRKAFSGKALAILQSDEKSGEIVLNASASGLSGDSIRVFTVAKNKDDDKTVVGVDMVNVTTNVDVAPELPSTISVYYSDSSVDTRNVTWEDIDSSLYNEIGKFTVEGNVEGISKKAKAVVTVKDVVAVKPYSTATNVGVEPVLPNKVTLLYSDDTTKTVNVTWDEIPNESLNTEGKFVVEGSIAETPLKAKAHVRVTSDGELVNIMLPENGTTYPKLEATYTSSGDDVNQINDGIKSYDDSPKNRWSSWSRTPRDQGDAITVDFGQSYNIDNLDLFVFTDRATVIPSSVDVQFWDGAEWQDVKNQTNPSPYVVKKNEIRFDPVSTDKLKFHMTPSEKDNFVALTEVEVYVNKIPMGDTAELSNLTVNGQALSNFDPKKHNYELTLPYGSDIPEINAEGADNATVTILPVFHMPGVAKVYVTSENGLVDAEYVIEVETGEPKLESVEIQVDKTEITEDDLIDLQVTGMLESEEVIDLTNLNPTYQFDKDIIKIEDNKLYALQDGEVSVTATIDYKGETITSSALTFKIAKNTAEKHIESLEPVTVITEKGKSPTLPKTVKAQYDIGLPREVEVDWQAVEEDQYANLGSFTVFGNVQGTTIQARAKIVVKGEIAVENVTTAILKNQIPELPDKVTVYFSDGTEEKKEVSWGDIPSNKLNDVGVFELEGAIKGTNLKAKAQISVTDEIENEKNISRAKNGYEYPKAEASFTNTGPGSSDRIEAINDDVISYEAQPHNRWTNWQNEARLGDWVSITFGDYAPEEYNVDNVEIHWFKDHGTSYPESLNIQYKSGDNWVDVTNLQSDPTSPTTGEANTYTFDMVKTSAIRVDMTAQDNMGLAITELKIFSKTPKTSNKVNVSDIELDGESILDKFNKTDETYEYDVEVSSLADLPQVSATSANNTSVTVVPSVTAPATAKVIATSEDGTDTITYNIQFNLDTSKLKTTVAEAKTRLNDTVEGTKPGQYPTDARNTLVNKINWAEAVLANDLVTLQDVSNAVEEMNSAIEAYNDSEIPENAEPEVDVAALEDLIKTAKAISNADNVYTENSYQALQEAITLAETTLPNIETEEALSDAMNKLQTAIDELNEVTDSKPDTEIDVTALEKLLKHAKAISNDNEVYTVSSYDALVKAIKDAETALENIETETALEKAVKALQAAIDRLVEEDTEEDTSGDDSSDNEQESTPEDNADSTQDGDEKLPNTATATYNWIVLGLLITILGAIIALRSTRKVKRD
ncbi:Beta-galactosidase [Paraliobacillus sp. PM-2]|uniref:Ig-like domain-containing protein n=1 Tax=Paraliobacillus sp. PM-2 TaxID=1462524 RepID=UPI00061BCB00|nr:Ig-like domain-containing protein [Paraliobacillus sp. PM-2]CQR47245.1 Beta-galactosidase [Paraliobacillus sp. PM-2]